MALLGVPNTRDKGLHSRGPSDESFSDRSDGRAREGMYVKIIDEAKRAADDTALPAHTHRGDGSHAASHDDGARAVENEVQQEGSL